jgi:hypothetical protein
MVWGVREEGTRERYLDDAVAVESKIKVAVCVELIFVFGCFGNRGVVWVDL